MYYTPTMSLRTGLVAFNTLALEYDYVSLYDNDTLKSLIVFNWKGIQ